MENFEKDILIALGLILLFVVSMVYFFVRRITVEHRKLMALQQEMLRHEVQSREVERKKIGEDLHDDLGPTLSYARMILSQILPTDEDQKGLHQKVDEALQESLTAVRTISFGLVPPDFENKSLNQAINTLCERLALPKNIVWLAEINEKANELPTEKRLHVYRIIQELVHNSVRHSGCSKIDIRLSYTSDNHFELDYRDDGRGLSPAGKGSGIGLNNIRNRASLLEGVIHTTQPEKGYQFLLNFPNF
ncbi:MAG: sensor histidine kinase [Flavobacteriales bacterium]|nr:sensor histidine kinase [Flavobacteriales bacterium]MDW8431489.1 sensor histidine kinase [Flavobacteriales bacterium]